MGDAVGLTDHTQKLIATMATNGRHKRCNKFFALRAPVLTNTPKMPRANKAVVTARVIATASDVGNMRDGDERRDENDCIAEGAKRKQSFAIGHEEVRLCARDDRPECGMQGKDLNERYCGHPIGAEKHDHELFSNETCTHTGCDAEGDEEDKAELKCSLELGGLCNIFA